MMPQPHCAAQRVFSSIGIALLCSSSLLRAVQAQGGTESTTDLGAPAADAGDTTVAPPAPPPPPPVLTPPTLTAPPPAGETLSEKLTAPPSADVTSLNLSGGGSMNTGNTKAYQILVGGDFHWVRMPHALTANAAFAYGRADVPTDTSNRMLDTVKNLNARAKYDFFLSERDALFVATGFRWDPFAGIRRRNNGQVGYGHYFIQEPKHRLWGEIGYDLTGTRYEALADGSAPAKTSEVVHSGRAFGGYENQLNESVTYLGGLEGLINLEKPGASRLNWDNALRSTLGGSFKLELKLRLAYEAQPVVRDASKLDTATVISVLYTLI